MTTDSAPGAVPSTFRIGRLQPEPSGDRPDLLAESVHVALARGDLASGEVAVTPVDPELSDTAAFCLAYEVPLARSANCVVVTGRRDGQQRWAAVVVLATTRADINGTVRRLLDVRKVSFAAQDETVSATGMEYGGITPVGLPVGWPVYVDAAVAAAGPVVIGAGIRAAKLIVGGAALGALPGAIIVDGLARPAPEPPP